MISMLEKNCYHFNNWQEILKIDKGEGCSVSNLPCRRILLISKRSKILLKGSVKPMKICQVGKI